MKPMAVTAIGRMKPESNHRAVIAYLEWVYLIRLVLDF